MSCPFDTIRYCDPDCPLYNATEDACSIACIANNLKAIAVRIERPTLGPWNAEQISTIVELLKKLYPEKKGEE